MDTGFITLHRKIIENPIWKNSQLSHLFLTLLLWSNHEEKKTLFNGKIEVIGRGQLITGRYALAGATGISPNTIKDYLNLLEKLEIITKKSTNKFTLISIVKYNDYQTKKEKHTSKNTNQTPARHQPDTTNNNVNNDNNVNNTIADKPPEISLLLEFFKNTVNPHLQYNNKTERKACTNLLNTYGLEKTKQALIFLEEKRKTDKYLPLITTPYELWTKWAKIKQHLTIKKRKIWKTSPASFPSLQEVNTK